MGGLFTALGTVSVFALVTGLVLLIINAIRKRPVKLWAFLMLGSFVLAIVFASVGASTCPSPLPTTPKVSLTPKIAPTPTSRDTLMPIKSNPEESAESFKASAATSDYYELARDLQNWLGKRVHVRGEVVTVFKNSEWLVVNITGIPFPLNRKDTWVSYSGSLPNLKRGDIVDIWGIVGKRTYETRTFGPVTTDFSTGILRREVTGEIVYSEPEIAAQYIDIVKAQQ